MSRKCIAVAVLLLVTGLVGSSWGEERIGRFSLAKAVPADSWLYFHFARNPEREFLEKHWSHVWEAVAAANFHQDIKRMFMKNMETEEDQEEFLEHWNKAVELFNNVDWGDLTKQECVLFTQQVVPLPEFTVLFKPQAQTAQRNLQGLKDILKELANLGEGVQLKEGELPGGASWTLSCAEYPVSLCLFQYKEEVIGLATSPQSASAAMEALAGDGKSSLGETERFKKAAASVPQPEDCIVYVDMKRLFKDFRKLVQLSRVMESEQEIGAVPSESAIEQQTKTQFDMLSKFLDYVDFIDYMVMTEETQKLQTLQHKVVKLQETAQDNPLCRMLTNQQPIVEFNKSVPKDALGFWVWSGLDLEEAYNFVLNFIRENVPDGQGMITSWEQKQQEWEFDFKTELCAWVGGQILIANFKPAVQTMFASPDSVIMLKVKDEAKAKEAIDKFLSRFTQVVQGQQPTLLVADANDVKAPGFKGVVYPPMAMMGLGKTVFGIHDGWLMVSNSPVAINKCLATRAGETASFYENERFRKEGIVAQGPVVFASFADKKNSSQELATMLFVLQMTAGMIPPDPNTKVIKNIFGMLGKLTPAVNKMNFTLSSSATCRFDGGRWIMEKITTYKKYVPPPPKPGPSRTPGEKSGKPKQNQELDGL